MDCDHQDVGFRFAQRQPTSQVWLMSLTQTHYAHQSLGHEVDKAAYLRWNPCALVGARCELVVGLIRIRWSTVCSSPLWASHGRLGRT